jgi:hypothetical protein
MTRLNILYEIKIPSNDNALFHRPGRKSPMTPRMIARRQAPISVVSLKS